jgi:hypothetical protein
MASRFSSTKGKPAFCFWTAERMTAEELARRLIALIFAGWVRKPFRMELRRVLLFVGPFTISSCLDEFALGFGVDRDRPDEPEQSAGNTVGRSCETGLVIRWFIVWLAVLPLAARAGAGQALLYSLSTGDPTPSPRIAKTEILAVDAQTGSRRVVFSDAGLTARGRNPSMGERLANTV